MLQHFDTLIDSYIQNKVGIGEDFIQAALAAHLKDNLEALFSHDKLRLAGTGNDDRLAHEPLFRNDKIYWLDRAHNNIFENDFFDIIDDFVQYLNETCYTGITGYEFHYTMYEAGSFYKKHFDQFRNNDSRKYSMIIYLNNNWQQGDGGELCIHQDDKVPENISPLNRKAVFFKSNELLHEVLVTHVPRMSVTGWLKIN